MPDNAIAVVAGQLILIDGHEICIKNVCLLGYLTSDP